MSDAEQTKELIQRVQQGNAAALDELCTRYLQRVFAAVRVQLGPGLRQKLESGDIVQEVMIEAVRKVNAFDFQTEGAFLHYLNCVVVNKIRDQADHWHAQRRDPKREAATATESDSALDYQAVLPATDPTPSQVLVQREDLRLLERALDALALESIEYRDLIVAVKLEGRSYAEIAAELGTSADAIRMRANRAMDALTRTFKRLDAGGV